MIKVFEKLPQQPKPKFSMPLSLRLIKESAVNNIDWKVLHIVDLYSILYSIRIDNANKYLENQRKEKLSQRGISEISKATEEDFDKL